MQPVPFLIAILLAFFFTFVGIYMVYYLSGDRYLVKLRDTIFKIWIKGTKWNVEWSLPASEIQKVILREIVDRSNSSVSVTYKLFILTQGKKHYDIVSEGEYPYVRLIAEELVNLLDTTVEDEYAGEILERGKHGVSIFAEIQMGKDVPTSDLKTLIETLRGFGLSLQEGKGILRISNRGGFAIFPLLILAFLFIMGVFMYQIGALSPSGTPLPIIAFLLAVLIISVFLLISYSVQRTLILTPKYVEIRERRPLVGEKVIARIPLESLRSPVLIWGKLMVSGWDDEGRLVIREVFNGDKNLKDSFERLFYAWVRTNLISEKI